MDVFLSWSQSPSREYAEIFNKYIPIVMQHVNPFMSSQSIEKGSIGTKVIYDNLSNTGVGLLFMTPNNISEQWINFEAGALFKGHDLNRVTPLLFDGCEKILKGPIRSLQYSEFSKDNVFAAFQSINNNSREEKLSEERLSASFDNIWEKIENEIKSVNFEYDESETEVDVLEIKLDRILDELASIKQTNNRKPAGSPVSNFNNELLKKIIAFSNDYINGNGNSVDFDGVDKKLLAEVYKEFGIYRSNNQKAIFNMVKMYYILMEETPGGSSSSVPNGEEFE
ncbi:hypothetical protein [Enterococcus larvae]|uniref:hypothetical protein n=1 Tax=Enterococcus larvae TaxID=2794352 RepID=UPI003F3FA880